MREVPVPLCTVWLVIDPVETGFPGARERRARRGSGILAGETRLQEGPSMEETPPEKYAGLRLMRSQGPD